MSRRSACDEPVEYVHVYPAAAAGTTATMHNAGAGMNSLNTTTTMEFASNLTSNDNVIAFAEGVLIDDGVMSGGMLRGDASGVSSKPPSVVLSRR